jgi:hypothetical protein
MSAIAVVTRPQELYRFQNVRELYTSIIMIKQFVEILRNSSKFLEILNNNDLLKSGHHTISTIPVVARPEAETLSECL